MESNAILTPTPEQLAVILEDHYKWLRGDSGRKANLEGANLQRANLEGANLEEAIQEERRISKGRISNGRISKGRISNGRISNGRISNMRSMLACPKPEPRSFHGRGRFTAGRNVGTA